MSLSPPGSFGEHYPLLAVDELACRVEVTGVAGGLTDHMQDDLAHVIEPPAAKRVVRPPGRRAVQGRGGHDRVGTLDLPPVEVQYRPGRQVRGDRPGVARIVLRPRLARDDGTEPEPLDV